MKTQRTTQTFSSLADFAESFPTQDEAARKLKISASYLSMLLNGQRQPSLTFMRRCADLGIPMESWREAVA